MFIFLFPFRQTCSRSTLYRVTKGSRKKIFFNGSDINGGGKGRAINFSFPTAKVPTAVKLEEGRNALMALALTKYFFFATFPINHGSKELHTLVKD